VVGCGVDPRVEAVLRVRLRRVRVKAVRGLGTRYRSSPERVPDTAAVVLTSELNRATYSRRRRSRRAKKRNG
jgi:hypothetical protein